MKLIVGCLSLATMILVGTASAQAPAPPAAPSPADPPPARAVIGYPTIRLHAQDQGIVLKYGDGPDHCDELGARDVTVWKDHGTYYMNYDGAGPKGWLVCAATSNDGTHWQKHGAVLALGAPGSDDSATASYGFPYYDGVKWWLYYLASNKASPPPDRVPIGPYLTMTAESASPLGPWKKRPDLGTLKAGSPGPVFEVDGKYLMIFNLGIARTDSLEKPWVPDPAPLFVPNQNCENVSIYYEPANKTWFLFTNHIGFNEKKEGYTDGIWMFWTQDLQHWDAANRAIAFDGRDCGWSKTIMGLPSVLKIGNRLAIYYDGREDPKDYWHMKRHIGLAWLDLPLQPPHSQAGGR